MRSQFSETKSMGFHSLSIQQLQNKEKLVLSVFTSEAITLTREQIVDAVSEMKLSSVCGRVVSLMAKGGLVSRGTYICPKSRKTQELVGLPVPSQLLLTGITP